MDAQLVITYISIGCYIFFALDVVVRMLLRIFNFEDYSPWQRHLYFLWGASMALVVVELIWDSMVYYYPQLTWDSTAHQNMREIELLIVPMLALVLWTLSTHRKVTRRQALIHTTPFAVGITLVCLTRDFIPWLIVVLYAGIVGYCLYILIRLIQNIRNYNQQLQQTYTDTHNRTLTWMIHLVWLFSAVLVLYVYFAYVEMDADYVYYSIVTIIWYYVNWNIMNMRETNELENNTEADDEARSAATAVDTTSNDTAPSPTSEAASATVAKQSLRELTKQRLEETLEETCLKRRLYLNPDLTVNDLAAELNTNRTYVSQYFSEHHTTFLKYINDLRVEYAMYQLKNTTHKISEVMYDSGFRHVETFRRAFQSRYNCDPREVVRTTK